MSYTSPSTLDLSPACCLRLKAQEQKEVEGRNLEQIEQR